MHTYRKAEKKKKKKKEEDLFRAAVRVLFSFPIFFRSFLYDNRHLTLSFTQTTDIYTQSLSLSLLLRFARKSVFFLFFLYNRHLTSLSLSFPTLSDISLFHTDIQSLSLTLSTASLKVCTKNRFCRCLVLIPSSDPFFLQG
jgi:hypothetical protein